MASSHPIEKSDPGVDRLGVREAGDRADTSEVLSERGRIDPARVVDRAADVGDGDDTHAERREEEDQRRADLAVALHDGARSREGHTELPESRLGAEHHARRRGADVARDPADGDRFAGDDAGGDVPLHHRDGVHDPGHDPGVGVHVRSGDVTVGAEQRRDVEGVPPGEPLQLPFRQRGRVDDNPALRAAERDVDDGALDRHVRGERHHLAHVDRGVEPDSALAGPARRAVLHPPTREHLERARHRAGSGSRPRESAPA